MLKAVSLHLIGFYSLKQALQINLSPSTFNDLLVGPNVAPLFSELGFLTLAKKAIFSFLSINKIDFTE